MSDDNRINPKYQALVQRSMTNEPTAKTLIETQPATANEVAAEHETLSALDRSSWSMNAVKGAYVTGSGGPNLVDMEGEGGPPKADM
jgi:hypothetical protein